LLGKTRSELLSQLDSRELSEWMAYFQVKAKREDDARRHREFLGADDREEIHY
jgi:hypothetical protein